MTFQNPPVSWEGGHPSLFHYTLTNTVSRVSASRSPPIFGRWLRPCSGVHMKRRVVRGRDGKMRRRIYIDATERGWGVGERWRRVGSGSIKRRGNCVARDALGRCRDPSPLVATRTTATGAAAATAACDAVSLLMRAPAVSTLLTSLRVPHLLITCEGHIFSALSMRHPQTELGARRTNVFSFFKPNVC